MNKNMYLGAWYIQETLTKAGYPTLAVGGFVRDYLLNKEAKDIDFATTATPEEMEMVFHDNGIVSLPTGLKHGTLTACQQVGDEIFRYEITTLRKDVSCDGRHADVVFTDSFEEDAKRRDFTINALYMDLGTGEIFDYVDGRKDLDNKLLRFVGNPYSRIKEDYLRAARFYRFLSQLNFNYDKPSRRAANYFCKNGYLSFVSVERIREELLKMIIGLGIEKVSKHRILLDIIPELLPSWNCLQKCKHHYLTVYEHTIKGLDYLKKRQDPTLSLAFLLHDIAKPFVKTTDEDGIDHFYGHDKEGARMAVRKICYNLRLSSQQTKRIEFIIKNHMKLHFLKSEKSLKRFIRKCEEFSPTILEDMCDICIADHWGMCEKYFYEGVDIVEQVRAIKEEIEDQIISPLNGKQIMDILGIGSSPIVGKIKNYLINKIMDNELDRNDYEALCVKVRKYYSTLL